MKTIGVRIALLLALALFVISASVTPVAAQAAGNEVVSVVGTQWTYDVPGDSLTNGTVTGWRAWDTRLINVPDGTVQPVIDATLSLASTLEFDWVEPEPGTGPPTYQWPLGDVLPGSTVGAKVGFSSPEPFPVDFEPGFDASRSVNEDEFSAPGTHIQTLTIKVTPREERERGYIDVLVYADGNPLVNPEITDFNGPGDQLMADAHVLLIRVYDLGLGDEYTWDVTIEVTPKVPEVEFMPFVRITLASEEPWNAGSSGSSFSHAESEEGTWTWSADGNYTWYWVESLSKSVQFPWYSTPNVEIDIRPLRSKNIILLSRYGRIIVAILSREDFDATSEVDRSSLTFGRTGDEESLARCSRLGVDVNHDGLKDLVCVFKTRLTGFQAGDTVGILKGKTVDGMPIEGRDSVTVVKLRR